MATWTETGPTRYAGPRRIRVVADAEAGGEVESTSDYAETYWLPVIGPTSLLLHRRLTRMVGQQTDAEFLARAVGISRRTDGRWSPFGRTMERLEQFGWIRQDIDGMTIHVRIRLPLLADRDTRKLPDGLRAEHDRLPGWIGCPEPGCGATAREDDLVGQAAHMTAQHPHLVALRQAESARWDGWEND